MHVSMSAPATPTPQLTGPKLVPFTPGTRATWFDFAYSPAVRDHTTLLAVNGGGPTYASVADAIAAATKVSAGPDQHAVAVLQATPTSWGIYSALSQQQHVEPDRTRLGYHEELGIPTDIAFEGSAYPYAAFAHAPLVAAVVDGASVWMPSFASAD
jgi:hypothetical protein